jgi:hypothetical protein
VIAESWSVDEILDAAMLDELEGAGQAKRLVGRVCAEVHNAVRMYAWGKHAKQGDQPPEAVRESQFLPLRVRSKESVELERNQRLNADQQLRARMAAMCGF